MKRKLMTVAILTFVLLLTMVSCDLTTPSVDTTTPETVVPGGNPSEPEKETDPMDTEASTEAPAPTAFPITVRVEGKGAVTFNNDDVVETLTKDLTTSNVISLTADPAEGYILKGWFEETDGERKLLHEEGSATFTVPAREVTLVAIFEKAFLLEVFTDDPDAGVFTANGEELTEKDWYAAEQTGITLTAVPADGYIFDAWYEIDADGNESRYANEATVEVTYGQIDRTLFCRFIKVYKGTLLIEGQGTVTVNGEERESGTTLSLRGGEQMTSLATPAEGYIFKGWYERKDGQEDKLLVETPDTTFIMPETACVIVAVFEKKVTLTVKVEDPSHGHLTAEGVDGTFAKYDVEGKGSAVTFTAYPAHGYAFHYWLDVDTNSILSRETTYSATVHKNGTVVAVFRSLNQLLVKSTAGGRVSMNGGSLTDLYIGSLAYMDPIELSAVADEGYIFKGFYTANAEGKPDKLIHDLSADVDLSMTEEDYSIIAVFEAIPTNYTIVIMQEDDAQGSFTVEGFEGTYTRFEDKQTASKTYKVTATPSPMYRFLGWYRVDGDQETLLSENETCTFTQPNADITVKAKYIRLYNVKFRVEGGGTFIANGQNVDGVLNVQLAVTDYMTLKAIAPANTRFVGWYEVVNGERILLYDQADVIFTVPARECTILAVFEDAHYLSINSAQGQFMLEGSEILYSDYSDHVYLPYEFTVIAQVPEGYRFDGWYEVRGDEWILLTNDLTYSGQMPDRDLHINARFEELYTVTVQLHGDWKVLHEESGITYADTFTLDLAKDEVFTLTIPWSGDWALDAWYLASFDGKLGDRITDDSIECPFTVSGDMTITPVFLPKYSLHVSTDEGIGSFTVHGIDGTFTDWGANDARSYTYVLNAVAPVGYRFGGWFEVFGEESRLISENPSYAAVVDGSDRRIVAVFVEMEDVLFTVYLMDFVGASFLWNGEEIPGSGWEWNLPYGSTVTVTVIPEEGYTFAGWYMEYFDEEYNTYLEFYSNELTVDYTCVDGYYFTLVAFVESGPILEGDIPPVVN